MPRVEIALWVPSRAYRWSCWSSSSISGKCSGHHPCWHKRLVFDFAQAMIFSSTFVSVLGSWSRYAKCEFISNAPCPCFTTNIKFDFPAPCAYHLPRMNKIRNCPACALHIDVFRGIAASMMNKELARRLYVGLTDRAKQRATNRSVYRTERRAANCSIHPTIQVKDYLLVLSAIVLDMF